MLPPDLHSLIMDWMILIVKRALPIAGHSPMYGGMVFERDLGNP